MGLATQVKDAASKGQPKPCVSTEHKGWSITWPELIRFGPGCCATWPWQNSRDQRELSHPRPCSLSRAVHNQQLVIVVQRPNPKAPTQNNSKGPFPLQSSQHSWPTPSSGYTVAQLCLFPTIYPSLLPQVFISRALPKSVSCMPTPASKEDGVQL